MSHRVLFVGTIALAFTSGRHARCVPRRPSASDSIDVRENTCDGCEVCSRDGVSHGNLGIQRAGQGSILQDGYSTRARLPSNAESDVVVSLGNDDGRRVTVAVAQCNRDVCWIGDDDVGTFDILKRPLLGQCPSASSHTTFKLRIALLLALVFHQLLTRHHHLSREAEATLQEVHDGDHPQGQGRSQDNAHDRADHGVDGEFQRNSSESSQVGEFYRRYAIRNVCDDSYAKRTQEQLDNRPFGGKEVFEARRWIHSRQREAEGVRVQAKTRLNESSEGPGSCRGKNRWHRDGKQGLAGNAKGVPDAPHRERSEISVRRAKHAVHGRTNRCT